MAGLNFGRSAGPAGSESREACDVCGSALWSYLRFAVESGKDSEESSPYKKTLKSQCDAGYPCAEFQTKYDKCVGKLGEHSYCSFLEDLVMSHCSTGDLKCGKESTSEGIKSTKEDLGLVGQTACP